MDALSVQQPHLLCRRGQLVRLGLHGAAVLMGLLLQALSLFEIFFQALSVLPVPLRLLPGLHRLLLGRLFVLQGDSEEL